MSLRVLRHLLNLMCRLLTRLLTGELGGGGAPVRVWQGVGPPRGGCGRGAPKGVWGGAREANAFFCVENPQKYVKAALKM